MRSKLDVVGCLAMLLAFGVLQIQPLQARVEPSHGFNMFSAQEEVQAGQQSAAQVARQLSVLPDSDSLAPDQATSAKNQSE